MMYGFHVICQVTVFLWVGWWGSRSFLETLETENRKILSRHRVRVVINTDYDYPAAENVVYSFILLANDSVSTVFICFWPVIYWLVWQYYLNLEWQNCVHVQKFEDCVMTIHYDNINVKCIKIHYSCYIYLCIVIATQALIIYTL